MITKEYIDSGAIESYVLGLSTAEEAAETEALSAKYPEIKQAIEEFSQAVEKYSFNNSVAPAAETKNKLLSRLSHEFTDEVSAPVIPIRLKQNINNEPIKMWQYIAAASILFFIISAGLNIYLYTRYQNEYNNYQALLENRNTLQADNNIYKTQLNEVQSANQNYLSKLNHLQADSGNNFYKLQQLQTSNDTYKKQMTEMSERFKIISAPEMQVVVMKALPGKANAQATVYWNANTKDVYLVKNNLPQTPADKQYQLWAIVNGKPVDAGLIYDCEGLCKMKTISNAQAFAITLEKKGGNTAPTMSAMFVKGGV